MKIRNGFVSNSSSSSFVVSFPNKPKSDGDVFKYMFGSKDEEISIYDNPGLSHIQIAKNVFKTLNCIKFKKATLEDVVSEFYGRYFYHMNSYACNGNVNDEFGGRWGKRFDRYFGSDIKLMNELRDVTIEGGKQDKINDKKESEIMAKSGLKQPKYAYKGGKDYKTEKPYTKKEIAAHEKYMEDLEEFKNTNDEYIEFKKDKNTLRNKTWAKERGLREQIAKKDARNFLDDNNEKFIFIVSYSDNGGSVGSTMEHGNIFRNVPHIRISNH